MKALIKKLTNLIALILLAMVFVFLAEDMAKEVKTYEEPDYADVAGCNPEITYKYQLCG